MIAHVGGVPLEELLPSVSGAGAGLLLARGWLMLHCGAGGSPGVSDEEAVRTPEAARPKGPSAVR